MNEQVITIRADGGMEGLLRKKDEGIDLRQFGKADVERASLIEFDNLKQQYYVHFLTGTLAGRDLTHAIYSAVTMKAVMFNNDEPRVMFNYYEDAVKVEIEVLDTIRLRGLEFTADQLNSLSKPLA